MRPARRRACAGAADLIGKEGLRPVEKTDRGVALLGRRNCLMGTDGLRRDVPQLVDDVAAVGRDDGAEGAVADAAGREASRLTTSRPWWSLRRKTMRSPGASSIGPARMAGARTQAAAAPLPPPAASC